MPPLSLVVCDDKVATRLSIPSFLARPARLLPPPYRRSLSAGLRFRRARATAGDIIRVPGSIGQAVDRACIIFIDRHAAGSNRTVGAVDDHIAVTDFDLTVAGAVYLDASTDLQLISQLHFVIGAAGRCW